MIYLSFSIHLFIDDNYFSSMYLSSEDKDNLNPLQTNIQ